MSSVDSVSSILSSYYSSSDSSSSTSSTDSSDDESSSLSVEDVIEINYESEQLLTDALSSVCGVDTDSSSSSAMDGLYEAVNMKMNEDSLQADLEAYYTEDSETSADSTAETTDETTDSTGDTTETTSETTDDSDTES